jgi:cytochrome c oxidase cbb3-type subunit 2
MYDHPFQWGSKRIGPDLSRVGGKYSSDWHYAHLSNPQALVPESLMPRYAFLAEHKLNYEHIADNMATLRMLGTPYTDEDIAHARDDVQAQAVADNPDAEALRKRYPKAVTVPGGGQTVTEMDALVAYLQVLGTMVDFADVTTEQEKQ